LLCFLGLHRLRPIHADLVREHSGRDPIFSDSKRGVVVGIEHAAGDRPFLRTIRHFAVALDQETSAPALLRGCVDFVDANARHLPRRSSSAPWDRRAREFVGFCRAHRHRRDFGFRLFAHRCKNFALPGARSSLGRIFKTGELTWPIPSKFERAMELTVADLANKNPAPAYAITAPESSAAPGGAAAATPAPSASPQASGTPKPTSVAGQNSEARGQPAAGVNPPAVQPSTQPGAGASPAASPQSPAEAPAASPSVSPGQLCACRSCLTNDSDP